MTTTSNISEADFVPVPRSAPAARRGAAKKVTAYVEMSDDE